MQARVRDDHPRIRVIQPAAVIVSWLIAAAGLLVLRRGPRGLRRA
jgi:hypothetical protein